MNKDLSTSIHSSLTGKRALYVAPAIEVIDVISEGVIASSDVSSPPSFGEGGDAYSSTRRGYATSPASDIENMINDILTIEE